MSQTDKAHMNKESKPTIAVLLPCYNEEVTVAKVVKDFRAVLPQASIYVFDNNSTDRTAELARDAGAIVVKSPRQGKGHVVRHMFETVEADIFVMADGDDTYPPEEAPSLIRTLEETGADMVVGMRLSRFDDQAFRRLHEFGNKLISGTISLLFRAPITDVLSGYRVYTREFTHSMYLQSSGFAIETELTLQALIKNCLIREVPVHYRSRPQGSVSKLNTFADGLHIFKAIFLIFKEYKPLAFFSILSGIAFILGLIAGWFPVRDYLQTSYVSHVPLAVLAAALEILAVLFLGIGLILNAVTRFHIETQAVAKRLFRAMEQQKSK
ncbi:glycosyltransferase [candidate division KSB1 bacterium]|nr:MAG: glycosyltransferase [candidate division KSB1 bacterium]